MPDLGDPHSELNWVANDEGAEEEIAAAAPSDEELLSAVNFPDFPEGSVAGEARSLEGVTGDVAFESLPFVSNDPTYPAFENRNDDVVDAKPNRVWFSEDTGEDQWQQAEYVELPESAVPTGSAERKAVPITSGVLDYFPAALVEVARVSKAGNDKHNPGQPLHHARGKSTDHADSLLRHLIDRGKIDAETGQRHSAEVAWRALALLQQELEDEGLAPLPRGARFDIEPVEVDIRGTA